jgi:hypothetical protein
VRAKAGGEIYRRWRGRGGDGICRRSEAGATTGFAGGEAGAAAGWGDWEEEQRKGREVSKTMVLDIYM